jgi:repressor LexA|tara:strand:- start:581 stop:784 length:204 start_codon:yes stop_codon:yes gene_type:complete
MTKRQKELLDYIRKYVKNNEMSPTYREMVKALNTKSVSNIGRMLDALAEEGKITRRIPAKPRSIKVL